MRPVVVLAASALVAFAAVTADAAIPGFRYGVAAGEVQATSAVLWTRAPSAGPVTLVIGADVPLPAARLFRARAIRANDLTVQVLVHGLRPRTRYRYAFLQAGSQSATVDCLLDARDGCAVGRFTTAPTATADSRVRFAYSGDADATPMTNGRPAFNLFQVYARMAVEKNDFNINLGDTIYSDSEVGGAPIARTVPQKWGKYKLALALPALRTLRASAGLYSHWDDHEFVNDFAKEEHGDAIYRAGVEAFRDYAPVTYSANLGLYRSFRWGKNLELFFLDERSFRSAKADDVCAGDLAPTAPQAVRDAFSSLAPSLKNPVSAECLGAIDDPARTMLGARQYAAFTRAIRASTATWKVIVNEVPIQQYYALPYDRWEGYEAERTKLLRFLQAKVKNVVFLTTDTHANLVNEVRYRTLGVTPEGSGIWEAVTGPVATNTFSKEIDRYLGAPGAGPAIGALFFKPPPPNGMGMRCAALDVYSYAEVTVTARSLTVALRDARGRPVREGAGEPCAPLVLRAR
jgi:alkaline phosphatase D